LAKLPFAVYNEIYGTIKRKNQLFHSVYINKETGNVEIRIDYLNTMSDTVVSDIYFDFLNSFIAQLKLPADFFKLKTLNIFSTIKPLYKDVSEGVLVELSFLTKTAVNIQIKRRKSKVDIREEVYHKAGEAAVSGLIDIYRIALQWHIKENIFSELLIPGNSGKVSTKDINEAVLKNCIFPDDFYFLRNKIFQYLQK